MISAKGSLAKVCAVYAIRNRLNGDMYVGATVNVQARWGSHRSLLRKGQSHNCVLQRAWLLYGEHNFEFVILKHCSRRELQVEEQRWLSREPAYNITLNANGGLPKGAMPKHVLTSSDRSKKRSPEQLEHLRTAQQRNWSEGGKRWSQRRILVCR